MHSLGRARVDEPPAGSAASVTFTWRVVPLAVSKRIRVASVAAVRLQCRLMRRRTTACIFSAVVFITTIAVRASGETRAFTNAHIIPIAGAPIDRGTLVITLKTVVSVRPKDDPKDKRIRELENALRADSTRRSRDRRD